MPDQPPLTMILQARTRKPQILPVGFYAAGACKATLLTGIIHSIWPAAVGHSTINATSVLPGYLLAGQPIALISPDPSALICGIGYATLALVLFFSKGYKGRKVKVPEENGHNQATNNQSI